MPRKRTFTLHEVFSGRRNGTKVRFRSVVLRFTRSRCSRKQLITGHVVFYRNWGGRHYLTWLNLKTSSGTMGSCQWHIFHRASISTYLLIVSRFPCERRITLRTSYVERRYGTFMIFQDHYLFIEALTYLYHLAPLSWQNGFSFDNTWE